MSALPITAIAVLLTAFASAGALQGPTLRDFPAPLPPALPVVPGLNSDFLDHRTAEDFAAVVHDHDGRYYTEEESDARFTETGHIHDDRYYTATESDGRFLTIGAKSADSDLLDGRDGGEYSLSGHDHDGRYLGLVGTAVDSDLLDGLDSAAFAGAGHNHDDRYFTGQESDGRYSNASHTHSSVGGGFGGMWGQYYNSDGLPGDCTANPLSQNCGCPNGFSSFMFGRVRGDNERRLDLSFCYRP